MSCSKSSKAPVQHADSLQSAYRWGLEPEGTEYWSSQLPGRPWKLNTCLTDGNISVLVLLLHPVFHSFYMFFLSLYKHLFIIKIFLLSIYHHFSAIILQSPTSHHTFSVFLSVHPLSVFLLCLWSQKPSVGWAPLWYHLGEGVEERELASSINYSLFTFQGRVGIKSFWFSSFILPKFHL